MFWRSLRGHCSRNHGLTTPASSIPKAGEATNLRRPQKTLSENQQRIVERTAACYAIAEDQLRRPFPRPQVHFNQRGKIAGSARLQLNELRFNPVLLNDNLQEFIDEVVPHEVCHLLAYQLYGKVRPHGKEWQSLMRSLFALKGQTKHQMDVSQVEGKTFSYRCQCQQHQLSVRRHNKVLRGVSYQCRQCAAPLKRC